MKCNECGAKAPAGATFCPQCGAQLGPENDGVAADRDRGAARMQAGGGRGSTGNVPEQELWTGSYSPKAMTGAFILASFLTVVGMIGASFYGRIGWIVVGIGALVLFGYLGLSLFYRRMNERYQLTTQRLRRETGILSRTDDRILVVEVDDITVRQGPIERLFNVGKIVIITKDETTKDEDRKYEDSRREDDGRMIMLGIENPRHVADLIDEARRTERTRGAMYMRNA